MPEALEPYAEFKEKYGQNVKRVDIKKAIEEIETYLAEQNNGGRVKKDSSDSTTDDDHNDEIAEAEFEAMLLGGDASAKKTTAAETPKSNKKRPLSSSGGADSSKSLPPKKKIKVKSLTATPTTTKSKSATPTTAKSKRKSQDDEAQNASLPVSSASKKSSKVAAVASFLDRPPTERPCSPSFAISNEPRVFNSNDLKPTDSKIGFLGLGIMGSGMVKNLIDSGHHVTVWNRTPEKCRDFVKAGAKEAITPGDVVAESDITFSCISDPQSVKDMVFGNCGVLSEINVTKSYVEMTGIDADTSQDIAEAISLKCGRYLEAQVQGSKAEAINGNLVVLVAGDRSLYEDCHSCFQAMSKNSFYLGEVGKAAKMNLIIQAMSGVVLAGLAEGMALGDRAGLKAGDILEILKLTSMNCPLVREKVQAFIDGGFPTNQPLGHLQKDLFLSMNLSQQLELPLPMTAAANEVFKHAKKNGYGDHDSSAVYIRARF